MLADRLRLTRTGITSGWNPSDKGADVIVSADRKTAQVTQVQSVRGQRARSSGVRQFEITISGAASPVVLLGVGTASANLNNFPGQSAGGWGYFSVNGDLYREGSSGTYGAPYAIGDVIGVVVNFSTGSLSFYKNGTAQPSNIVNLTGVTVFPFAGSGTGTATLYPLIINTGDSNFSYPVSGAIPWG